MTARRSTVLAFTRPVHRWLGLLALAYFLAMGLSGILLNHPELIAGLDVPRAWIPGDYHYHNWNRNALRGSVRAGEGIEYLYGESGVWVFAEGAAGPVPFAEGLPSSTYYRDVRALLLLTEPIPFLLAGTRGGLYGRPLAPGSVWERIALPGGEDRDGVVDLLRVGPRAVALTRHRVLASERRWPPLFVDVTPERMSEPQAELPLFRLVFHLHSGDLWGIPGRLVVDGVGVLLVFLCLSGGFFWWRRRTRSLAAGVGGRMARTGLAWHNRLGFWLAPCFLFLAVTGILQRPPFLIAIAGASYPPRFHPGPPPANPWEDLLRKALYDPARDTLLLATADGFFEGPSDLSRPFVEVRGGPPVSVMGTTVLRKTRQGLYLVGSMSGLYGWDPRTGWVADAFTGLPPQPSQRGPVGERQVVGFYGDVEGRFWVADYAAGLAGGSGPQEPVPMPGALRREARMSLWHLLFEFHNGRLFGFALGWWTWLLVPLGGVALALEIVTGVADYWLPRRRRRRGSERPAHQDAPGRSG